MAVLPNQNYGGSSGMPPQNINLPPGMMMNAGMPPQNMGGVGGMPPQSPNMPDGQLPGYGQIPGQTPIPWDTVNIPGTPGMTPTAPQLGENNPYSPWKPLTPPPMPVDSKIPGAPGLPRMPGAPGYNPYGDGTQFGGVSTINPNANPADYDSVRGFANSAYDQSMRNLQPQMDQQNRRFDQTLINQGIDPNSKAGQDARAQMDRGQNDLRSKATFDALAFGQGIQNQMFGQDLSRSQLASGMQMGEWGNNTAMNNLLGNTYGNQLGFLGQQGGNMANMYGAQLGLQGNMNNNATSRYNSQLQHSLGMGNLELGRQQQDWSQMMGMEGLNQWNQTYNRQGDWRNQDLTLALMGLNVPQQSQIGTGGGNFQPGGVDPWSNAAGEWWKAFGPQMTQGGGS